ncbi:MAG: barstar family protein [Pseudomonadota bacterium]
MSEPLAATVQAWLESDAVIVHESEHRLEGQVEAVVAEIHAQGSHAVWVDPAPIHNKMELLEALYRALHLPGWFGFNYDALQDALEMLEPINGRLWVLVFRHFDVLQDNDPDCAAIFIQICRQVMGMDDRALFKLILL